jgi:hypothetical protein
VCNDIQDSQKVYASSCSRDTEHEFGKISWYLNNKNVKIKLTTKQEPLQPLGKVPNRNTISLKEDHVVYRTIKSKKKCLN